MKSRHYTSPIPEQEIHDGPTVIQKILIGIFAACLLAVAFMLGVIYAANHLPDLLNH